MATDKIILEFQAETAKLRKELDGVKKQLGVIDKEAAEANDEIGKMDKQAPKLSSSFKKLGVAIAAAFSVAVIKQFISESIRLATIQQQSEAQLLQALKGREAIQKNLIKQAQQLQALTTFGDEEIIRAQSLIAAFVKEEEQIKKLTEVTLDLAAAKGFDLTSASDLITKTFASSTNALSRYGIEVEGAAGSTERLESLTNALNNAFEGQAQALAETNAGRLIQLNNLMGDVKESFGAAILEGIAPFVTTLKDGTLELNEFLSDTDRLVSILRSLATAIAASATAYLTYNTVIAANTTVTKIATIAQQGFNTAIKANPVGLIASLLATAAAAFITYKVAVDDATDSQTEINESVREFGRLITAINEGNELGLFTITQLESAYNNLNTQLETNKKLREESTNLLPVEKQTLDNLIASQEKQLEEIHKEISLREEQKESVDSYGESQNKLVDRINREREATNQLYVDRAELSEQLDELIAKQKEYGDAAQEASEKAKDSQQEYFNQGIALGNQLFNFDSAVQEQQAQNLRDRLDKGIIDQKKYDRELARLKRQQAIADKAQASFNVVLSTAQAVMRAQATGVGVGLIPLILATSAAQLAAIAAQPIPKFAKGGEIGGKLHSQGGTLIEAEKGEYVINRNAYAANKQAVEAINTNRFHDYIMKEAQKVAIAQGQGVAYDDTALIYAVRRNKDVNVRNADSLGKAFAKQLSRQKYFDV